MRPGLLGSGNMARAMARGWQLPVLCSDIDPARAQALAAEVGGEAVDSNVELAERADVLVLCHKPPQLEEIAKEIGGRAKVVASILAATPRAKVSAAYPEAQVFRFIPNLPVEVAKGVLAFARVDDVDPALAAEVRELFGKLGEVVELDDALIDVAMGLTSNSPAYWALAAEAQIDAGVRHGLPADVA